MIDTPDNPNNAVMATPHLADSLESPRFKQFLDHVPFGVAVAEFGPPERIVYVNVEFERVVGLPARELEGQGWEKLPALVTESGGTLAAAITGSEEHIGLFRGDGETGAVDAWSNTIADDDGTILYRLVAVAAERLSPRVTDALGEKDTLLRELQHRVKNNLQMITALIRMEIRNTVDETSTRGFARLAGRVEALALLYDTLSEGPSGSIDLGVYLTQVATAVMRAHAPEGIRLDMKVDTWPASVDVAMPTGLVVNELLTNALKYAFRDEGSGTITLRCVVEDGECRVVVADDGVGLPEGETWPKPGKLSALIVQSLRQNAKAMVKVESEPGKGVRATILFAKRNAAPPENA